jgi:hypothetical protein
MPVCSGLYGRGGGRTTPNPNRGIPDTQLRSSTFNSFDTPKNGKCSELKMISPWVGIPATTAFNLDDTSETSNPRNRVPIRFFGPKKLKSRSQSILMVINHKYLYIIKYVLNCIKHIFNYFN